MQLLGLQYDIAETRSFEDTRLSKRYLFFYILKSTLPYHSELEEKSRADYDHSIVYLHISTYSSIIAH
jgi:hypothetical protein